MIGGLEMDQLAKIKVIGLGGGGGNYNHYSLLPDITILDAPVLNEIEFKE